MEWPTDRRLGTRVTLGLMVWLALFDGLLIWIATLLPITLLTFFLGLVVLASLPLFALLGYWLIGLRGAGYALDRNALTIIWGPTRQIIPLSSIERIEPGAALAGRIRSVGAYWPGLWVGHGQVEGLGLTLFYATTIARDEILWVITPGLAYAISPIERARFLEAFAQRKAMGPTQVLETTFHRPAWLDWPLWRDRLAWGLVGLAAVILGLLFGFLTWRWEGLPAQVPLHFNLAGLPDRMGDRSEIFRLPFIGLMVLMINGGRGGIIYHAKERFGAYWLWGGALLVQVMLWIAVLGMLSR